jgi:hypothetical protein
MENPKIRPETRKTAKHDGGFGHPIPEKLFNEGGLTAWVHSSVFRRMGDFN